MAGLHDLIVAEKDFLAGLASLSGIFALFVPLPIFLFTILRQRRNEARDRAFALIDSLESPDAAALRRRVLAIVAGRDVADPAFEAGLSDEDRTDMRRFMNDHERIGVQLNAARIDRRVFAAFWGVAYVFAWDRLAPAVQQLRARLDPALYEQWEKAAGRLRAGRAKRGK